MVESPDHLFDRLTTNLFGTNIDRGDFWIGTRQQRELVVARDGADVFANLNFTTSEYPIDHRCDAVRRTKQSGRFAAEPKQLSGLKYTISLKLKHARRCLALPQQNAENTPGISVGW